MFIINSTELKLSCCRTSHNQGIVRSESVSGGVFTIDELWIAKSGSRTSKCYYKIYSIVSSRIPHWLKDLL